MTVPWWMFLSIALSIRLHVDLMAVSCGGRGDVHGIGGGGRHGDGE